MKIKRLSNKEIRALNKDIESFGVSFKKGDELFMADAKVKVILYNKSAVFFYNKDRIFPTLKAVLSSEELRRILPTVTVDKGAVKFILNGADVMRPGILEVSDFDKDSPVIVEDEKHRPISVALSLYSSKDILSMSKGPVLKNLHQFNDSIWNFHI